MNKQRIVIASGILVVLAFVLGIFFYNKGESKRLSAIAGQDNSVFNRPLSPTYGPPGAKVRIVEFFDPACETCKIFYPMVKKLVDAQPGKIQLVIRYAPFHEGSRDAVAILEAARMQGVFWPVLEAMLKTQDIWSANHQVKADLIWAYLDGTSLNILKARDDMFSPQVRARIDEDVADAKSLNVTKTPGFFVNGKPLKDFGFSQLKALVQEEVDSAYPR